VAIIYIVSTFNILVVPDFPMGMPAVTTTMSPLFIKPHFLAALAAALNMLSITFGWLIFKAVTPHDRES
jgi:hypothetical protein